LLACVLLRLSHSLFLSLSLPLRQGVIANAKHFINNNQETNRGNVSANVDERTEMEMYFPPFLGAAEAGVLSVMCSYNRINGDWACENSWTLSTILKGHGNFSGWVMSDWGGTHSTEQVTSRRPSLNDPRSCSDASRALSAHATSCS
jgi:beta-glucosidase-like glycosyl hydrolase